MSVNPTSHIRDQEVAVFFSRSEFGDLTLLPSFPRCPPNERRFLSAAGPSLTYSGVVPSLTGEPNGQKKPHTKKTHIGLDKGGCVVRRTTIQARRRRRLKNQRADDKTTLH
jgi:hypothetical protein